MRTYEQYRNSLGRKKYKPLPKEVVNEYVIKNINRDQVANSCQRLIASHITNIIHHYQSAGDDLLFELVGVGNEAIAYSMKKYTRKDIDFALFCSYNIRNMMISYLKRHTQTIRARKIDGEMQSATYLYLDHQEEDMGEYEIDDSNDSYEIELDIDFIYKQLSKDKWPISKRSWDMYVYHLGLIDGKTKKKTETAKHFECSGQNVATCVINVQRKIKKNELVKKYLSQFV